MTGNRANIPRQNSDLGGGSPPSREWYNFFRRVGDFVNRAELGGNTIVNQGDTIINNGTGSLPVAIGYSEGESFPQNPSLGQKFYRTDLNWLCFYDGTRWLTCHEYALDMTEQNVSRTGTAIVSRSTVREDFTMYLTKLSSSSRITGGTNNATNYWTVSLQSQNASFVETVISSFSTASDAPNSTTNRTTTLNYVMPTTAKSIESRVTITGSPSNLLAYQTVYYRLIVT